MYQLISLLIDFLLLCKFLKVTLLLLIVAEYFDYIIVAKQITKSNKSSIINLHYCLKQ